ncbi:hypothetical protein F2Q70_00039399 [Brassica cretica]|uniref:Uncharacterized protein n=1 Tax=Brassica cretica TaxID=69181 RepID=A0A8S9K3Z4_BRACR|nr:hypothetical protein F2Q70_00039399 [Brassica cretica]
MTSVFTRRSLFSVSVSDITDYVIMLMSYDIKGLSNRNEEAKEQEGEVCGFDRDLVLEKLKLLKKSLEHQRARVLVIIEALSGEKEERNREEELLEMVEKLKIELEAEKMKTLRAEKESVLS